MLATAGELCPTDDAAWGYEFKWDGVRAVAAVRGGVLALISRKGTDITVRYPELARLPGGAGRARRGGRRRDRRDGRRRAAPTSARCRTGCTAPARRCRAWRPTKPVTYLVFDLLAWDGEDLLDRPVRRAPGAAGRAGHRRAPLGGRRRGSPGGGARRAGRQRGERAGGRRRQAAGLALPARACAAPTGARSRTSAPRRSSSAAGARGRAGGPGAIGSLLVGVPGRRGPAGLRRARRHRVQRPGPARPAADVHRAADVAVRGRAAAGGDPRRALGRAGPGRRGRLRRLDVGRPAAAPRPGAGCATTWSPTTWWSEP